ncbi:hypothetical protein [Burkholderia contaminans]|uniref:Uncharacterized protein n=1 Tax=Burkholderia contaminans TaxID=488447 RepID=A0A6P2Y661_9BURK|nr:hypothetical protein [Burkholderia contaminans]VWD17307.1 hypothetical protein BCO71171_02942 [Burkholderia contaminans]
MNDRRTASYSIYVGAGEYLTPAQLILMFGFLTYEAPRAPMIAKSTARTALAAILSAAAAGGFKSSDLLDTLMSRAERSARVDALAEGAVCAIGDANAFIAVIRRAGISLEAGL